MYVSYDFYKKAFGGIIPAESFPRAEMQAEAHIRALTYINGDIFATESDTIMVAVCAAAEVIYQHEKAGSTTGLRSESNDGYSVSYVTEAQDGQTTEEVLRKKVYEAIRLYLLSTGWLSRKVKPGGGGCDGSCDCDHCL